MLMNWKLTDMLRACNRRAGHVMMREKHHHAALEVSHACVHLNIQASPTHMLIALLVQASLANERAREKYNKESHA
jgi:hypothetical protein